MIGLVLAGGHSKRFGQDKAFYDGKCHSRVNNVQLAVDNLRGLCSDVFVTANANNFLSLQSQFKAQNSVHVLQDCNPFIDAGPLSGIFALNAYINASLTNDAAQNTTRDILMLPVDYPNLTSQTLATLSTHQNCYAATPTTSHYTIAHFTVTYQKILDTLTMENRRLGTFLTETCQCLPFCFPPSQEFNNINTLKERTHDK